MTQKLGLSTCTIIFTEINQELMRPHYAHYAEKRLIYSVLVRM